MGVMRYGRYQVTRSYEMPIFEDPVRRGGRITGYTDPVVTIARADGKGFRVELSNQSEIELFEVKMKERQPKAKELLLHVIFNGKKDLALR